MQGVAPRTQGDQKQPRDTRNVLVGPEGAGQVSEVRTIMLWLGYPPLPDLPTSKHYGDAYSRAHGVIMSRTLNSDPAVMDKTERLRKLLLEVTT
jgi:hypothetical protein